MPADPRAAVGTHAPADVEVLVRRVLASVAVVEPISVDADTAARLVGVSSRTLRDLPAEQTGKFRLGTRTLYHLAKLRQYVAELVKGQAKN